MKKLGIILSWIILTTITLFSSTTFYSSLSSLKHGKGINERANHQAVVAYAALPSSVSQIRTSVLGADARPVTIDAYLKTYNSPLTGLGSFIVNTADKFELDPYLIVAIAQQESNLCKLSPQDSNNCWGWGIHQKGTLKFENYQQAILAVSQGLKEEYLDKGYIRPELIMYKYTPQSNGSWARGVNQFLAELNSGDF